MRQTLISLSESAGESAGATPYIIGATALGILFALLLIVIAIGGGREHS